MKIEFDKMNDTVLKEFKGGEKNFVARMYSDELGKIMKGCLEPGASIGMHTHETGSEIIFILSGEGIVLYDDGKEILLPGDCHYCPMGHTHSLRNEGEENLIFYAVVTEVVQEM